MSNESINNPLNEDDDDDDDDPFRISVGTFARFAAEYELKIVKEDHFCGDSCIPLTGESDQRCSTDEEYDEDDETLDEDEEDEDEDEDEDDEWVMDLTKSSLIECLHKQLLLEQQQEEQQEEQQQDEQEPEGEHMEAPCDGQFAVAAPTTSTSTTTNTTTNETPPLPVPWWYSYEDEALLTKLFLLYGRFLKVNEDDHHCIKDARRLSQFVGRVERRSVRSGVGFTTVDKVEIFRRDIRPIGSLVSLMQCYYLLTPWDLESGIPHRFDLLSQKSLHDWEERIIREHPVSFLHCMPVWESKTGFQFSVSSKKLDVGYAKEPFHYTKYLPQYLRCFMEF